MFSTYLRKIKNTLLNTQPEVWLLQSDTKRSPQSYELAVNLTNPSKITKIIDTHYNFMASSKNPENNPDFVIGCGIECHGQLQKVKSRFQDAVKTISILDNSGNANQFDVVVTPSYEPHSRSANIIETTGLINRITPDILNEELKKYNASKKYQGLRNLRLKAPFIAVLLGGLHTSGNLTSDDAKKLAGLLNKLAEKHSATLLITSSQRTEASFINSLKGRLTVNHFIYDYKYGRDVENPYKIFLALSDHIVATGDSIRMMSEACSSGKKVYIYDSSDIGFQYKALSKQLFANGHAMELNEDTIEHPKDTLILSEAKRVAEIIKSKFT